MVIHKGFAHSRLITTQEDRRCHLVSPPFPPAFFISQQLCFTLSLVILFGPRFFHSFTKLTYITMISHSFAYTAFASLAAAQTIQFDGRVPAGTKLTDFDSANDFFGSTNVLGEGLKFSDLLLLPNVDPSLLDVDNTVPIEVTIR